MANDDNDDDEKSKKVRGKVTDNKPVRGKVTDNKPVRGKVTEKIVPDELLPSHDPSQTAKQGPPVAFTNNPALAGTEAAPGIRYVFAPDDVPLSESVPELKPKYAEFGAGSKLHGSVKEASDVPDLMNAIEMFSKADKPEAVPPRPTSDESGTPPQVNTSDGVSDDLQFTFEDREKFRNQIIQNQFGGTDPYTIDVSDFMERITAKQQEQWFDEFTGGKVAYEDRELLDAKEQQAWTKYYTAARSEIKNAAKEKRENAIKLMDNLLSRWDAKAKEVKESRQARLQPPKTEYMENTAGELTMHQWNPNKQTWVDTGKKKLYRDEGGPTTGQRIKYVEDESLVASEYHDELPLTDPGDQIPGSELQYLNDKRKLLGMPILKEVAEGKKFKYIETGKEGESIYTPEESAVLQQNLRAYKGADNYYYVNDANGKPFRISPKADQNKKSK